MKNFRLWGVFFLLLAPTLTAQDKYFDSDGVRIRYIVQGAGEPVVLVHGFEGSMETWVARGIISNLARDYQVIAFDMRGHGKSAKPHSPSAYGREMALDIVRLLDHLGIARAHIVGFSLGSQLTSQLLTLRPDRFLTATLIAGAGRLEWTDQQARDAEQEAVEHERQCISQGAINRLFPPDRPRPTEQQIAALSAACMADSTQDRFALAAAARSRGDQRITPADAAAVKVPTLAVVGSLDPARKGLETLKSLRPDLKLVIVDGATHAGDRGIIGRPELMTALREFLAANRVKTLRKSSP
jgi:pimeloyl-ACP methyl ester carboxylesterase